MIGALISLTACAGNPASREMQNQEPKSRETDEVQEKSVQEEADMNTEIMVAVNDRQFKAELNDSEAARQFYQMLPLSVDMKELNGNEKYYIFPKGLEAHDENVESMPLPESIAMSQGYIGYHLQLALNNHFRKEKLNTDVATILTQIIVDENDLSFHNPTKPIGPFYTKEEIEQKGFDHYVEDSGRGYRQVVASPLPQSIVEVELVKRAMDAGTVVICSGGGGIPLVDTGSEFKAVDAVIDKDAAAALLAKQIDADMLVILTAVDQVALNFGKENVSYLDTVNVRELEQYITEKHFAPGSMLPKVEAAKRFVIHHKEAIAVITSLELASEAIIGTKGTQIIN